MSYTPGPWMVATSNSWRRIVSTAGGYTPVCEPITQNDGHPDLHFRNGGEDGPDARLIAAAPCLLDALQRSLNWLASYPGGGALGCYDQARAAITRATGAQP